MKLNKLTVSRFVLAILTIAAIALHSKIPPKSIALHPYTETFTSIYGQDNQFHWTDEEASALRCQFKRNLGNTPCGIVLIWNPFNIENLPPNPQYPLCQKPQSDKNSCKEKVLYPLDFSKYDGIKVDIHYEGRAQALEIKLNNYEPELAALDKVSEKRMTAMVHTKDLKAGPAFIKLSEFIVDEWWIWENNIPRQLASSAYNNIVMISIDTAEQGIHNLRLNRIELIGERLNKNDLLTILAALWLFYLFSEALARYVQFYVSTKKNSEAIEHLQEESEQIQEEKLKLEVESTTDNLTGVFNRHGMIKEIEPYYSNESNREFGLMVLDIDRFKNINDSFGHDVGDLVIRDLATLISKHIRQQDVYARWGGEEFLLFCPDSTLPKLIQIAEKLRNLVADHNFSAFDDGKVTVSIGLASARENENFNETFKRADAALYQAKVKRNKVCYEE